MVAERLAARWVAQYLQVLFVAGTVACWAAPCAAQTAPTDPIAPTDPTTPTTPAPSSSPPTEKTLAIGDAREAFLLGAALAHQGQWNDALAAFERSYRSHAHPATLFNIGFCERALGRFTRARKSFRAALSAGPPSQTKLEAELATEAQGYLREVERRIVRATVVIRQPSLRLTVNGRPLEAETSQPQGRTFFVAGTRDSGPPEAPPVAVFELLLDPGEQSIVISTDGVDHVVARRFDAGSSPRIELAAPEPIRSLRTRSATLPAIAYGVGAAGLVIGSVFGVATLENAKALNEVCPEKKACPGSAQAELDASERNSLVANVGFGVGLAGGIVGTWLLLTDDEKERPRSHAPSIRAHLGVGQVNFEGSF